MMGVSLWVKQQGSQLSPVTGGGGRDIDLHEKNFGAVDMMDPEPYDDSRAVHMEHSQSLANCHIADKHSKPGWEHQSPANTSATQQELLPVDLHFLTRDCFGKAIFNPFHKE